MSRRAQTAPLFPYTTLFRSQQFQQLNPGPINVACSNWARAAGKLGTIANRLMTEAGQALHQAWESRSEEHTSELQSRRDLVCRLLLEKKNSNTATSPSPSVS